MPKKAKVARKRRTASLPISDQHDKLLAIVRRENEAAACRRREREALTRDALVAAGVRSTQATYDVRLAMSVGPPAVQRAQQRRDEARLVYQQLQDVVDDQCTSDIISAFETASAIGQRDKAERQARYNARLRREAARVKSAPSVRVGIDPRPPFKNGVHANPVVPLLPLFKPIAPPAKTAAPTKPRKAHKPVRPPPKSARRATRPRTGRRKATAPATARLAKRKPASSRGPRLLSVEAGLRLWKSPRGPRDPPRDPVQAFLSFLTDFRPPLAARRPVWRGPPTSGRRRRPAARPLRQLAVK